jgi:hypothetical protein
MTLKNGAIFFAQRQFSTGFFMGNHKKTLPKQHVAAGLF